MKRADWQKLKTEAAKYNNGKPVKFPKDLGLGPALDALNAAIKKRDATDIGTDKKAWAIASQQWLDARTKAGTIAATYDKQLDTMAVNEQAKKKLKEALFDFLKTVTGTAAVTQGKATKARIDQIKRDLAANR